MKLTDNIYRTLVDAAFDDRRAWTDVGDLAWQAGVSDKLAYKVLGQLAAIGAVAKHPGRGFSVTDPERILMILAARRSLADARSTTLEAAESMVERQPLYAIGGTRAAAHHLGGVNTIADHAPTIVYVPEDAELPDLPAGDDALVVRADARSLGAWTDGFTSAAQTFADLFAQPGWQASEFRRALWKAWFAIDDWSRQEA